MLFSYCDRFVIINVNRLKIKKVPKIKNESCLSIAEIGHV